MNGMAFYLRGSASLMFITTTVHVLVMLKQDTGDGLVLSNRKVLQVIDAVSLLIKVWQD